MTQGKIKSEEEEVGLIGMLITQGNMEAILKNNKERVLKLMIHLFLMIIERMKIEMTLIAMEIKLLKVFKIRTIRRRALRRKMTQKRMIKKI